MLGRQFYNTSQYKISLVFIIPSFISLTSLDNIKETSATWSWSSGSVIPKWLLFSIMHCTHVDEYTFVALFILRWDSSLERFIRNQWKCVWSCSLCDFSVVQKLQGRSLCQEFCFSLPRGLLCSIFLLQQVPRLYQCYLFIAFPSLPNRRHRWHWLRCVKNLLMCLNYLCLMLGASVSSSALGQHYSCDGNSLRIAALHPILLRCCERCHEAQRPL